MSSLSYLFSDFDWINLIQLLYVSHSIYKFMCTISLLCSVNTVLIFHYKYLLLLVLIILLHPFLRLTLQPCREQCGVNVIFIAEQSTASYPLTVDQLCVSL